MAGRDEIPGLADYKKFLQLTKDEAAEIFRKSDKKQVWFNPDPKDKDTYASAEVLSETGGETGDTVLKTEQGDVCWFTFLFIFLSTFSLTTLFLFFSIAIFIVVVFTQC